MAQESKLGELNAAANFHTKNYTAIIVLLYPFMLIALHEFYSFSWSFGEVRRCSLAAIAAVMVIIEILRSPTTQQLKHKDPLREATSLLEPVNADNRTELTALLTKISKGSNVASSETKLVRKLLEGEPLSLGHYHAALTSCVQDGNVLAAEAWFTRLCASREASPTRTSFGLMLAACARAKDQERAKQCLNRMAHEGIELDPISHSIALRAGATVASFRKMAEDHGGDSDYHANAYKVFAADIAENGDVFAAELLLREMKAARWLVVARVYNAALRACAANRDARRANEWMTALLETSSISAGDCYLQVIRACARAGESNLAVKWLDAANQAGCSLSDDHYCPILRSLAKQKAVQQMDCLWMAMLANGVEPSDMMYTSMMKAYWLSGDVETAWVWYWKREDMRNFCEASGDLGWTSIIAGGVEAWESEMLGNEH